MATTATTISEQEYRERVFNDPARVWELWDGVPVEKPLMSAMHDGVSFFLGFLLQSQLDPDHYLVNVNGGKTRYTSRNYYTPDIVVIPTPLVQPLLADPYGLNAYTESLPFVAEVWSPSTGNYDIVAKIPVYQQRGDLEIWFYHPYERTLAAQRRQLDGSYREKRYTGGIVPIDSLPGVTIDLDALPGGKNWAGQP
jgi:Uma2 family endonuclease